MAEHGFASKKRNPAETSSFPAPALQLDAAVDTSAREDVDATRGEMDVAAPEQSPTGHEFRQISVLPTAGTASSSGAANVHPNPPLDDGPGLPASVVHALGTAQRSPSSPLPEELRRTFERSLRADLSSIRIHRSPESIDAADAIGARAFAIGSEIHFNRGEYAAGTAAGQHLLAHEVAHTVQRRAAPMRMDAPSLRLSRPDETHEIEAERSAGAIQLGAPVDLADGVLHGNVVQRQPLGFSQPTVAPIGGSGGGVDLLGIGSSPFGLPPQQAPILFAPNTDAIGVPYDVPPKDYRADVKPSTPPFDAAMPSANIFVPPEIPGWKAPIPPKEVGDGPLKITLPGNPDYVVTRHSASITSAWDAYKFHLIPDVAKAWNDLAPAIDTFTQTKKGDPDLEKTVADMGTKSRFNIPIKQKKGMVTDQAAHVPVGKGTVLADVDSAVAHQSDSMKAGLSATGLSSPDSPVRIELLELQAKRDHIREELKKANTKVSDLETANLRYEAAFHGLKARELEEQKEKQEQEKKDIESGMATLKSIDPELARTVKLCKDLAVPLKALADAGKGAAEAAEGDPMGLVEAAKGVMEVAKWAKLQDSERKIAITVDGIKRHLDDKTTAEFSAAQNDVQTRTAEVKGIADALEPWYQDEKVAYEKLAKALKEKWKGSDSGEGELAAKALQAIPTVEKICRFLNDVRRKIPKELPDSFFNADKGYRLATEGVNAPGAADLLEVAGWIKGAGAAIDEQIEAWNDMLARLQSVASQLGIV